MPKFFRVAVVDDDRQFSPRIETVDDTLDELFQRARRRGGGPFENKRRTRGSRWSRPMDRDEARHWQREKLLAAEIGDLTLLRTKRGTVLAVKCAAPPPVETGLYEAVPVVCGGYGDSWGAPRDGGARDHMGVDIGWQHGMRILAPIDGVLRFSDRGGNAGFAVDVLGKASDGTPLLIRNFHCKPNRVRPDGPVQAGDFCGLTGDTGSATSAAPHSHFEQHNGVSDWDGYRYGDPARTNDGTSNGTAVDPKPALDAAYGQEFGGTKGPGRPC